MTYDLLQRYERSEDNPFTVVYASSSYTADYSELVIADGAEVTLPSPKADQIVAIRDTGQQPTIRTPSGSVSTHNQARVSSQQTVYFVSDGNDWYTISDQQFVGVGLPSSAVRQWPLTERQNGTIVERLANDNGSISGGPSNTADGGFYEGYYEATDGTDDALLLPVGEFETQIQSVDFGIAFTVRSSGFSDGDILMAAADSNYDHQISIQDSGRGTSTGGDGVIEILFTINNSISAVETSTNVADGAIHRCFVRIQSNNPANWEFYVDDSADSLTVLDDSGIDLANINLSSAVNDIGFCCRNTAGSLNRHVDMDADNPILYDSPTRQDVTDDYNYQPWS